MLRYSVLILLASCSGHGLTAHAPSIATTDAGDSGYEAEQASDAGQDRPFIPSNEDAGSDANPWCQDLWCDMSVVFLPSCAAECTVFMPPHNNVMGHTCQTCANPDNVTNCGYFCVYPADE
jgi:hypothetical protein